MGLADDVKHIFPTQDARFRQQYRRPADGTILVRGTFPNPYELPDRPPMLMPGLFVRVSLEMGPPHKTLLVSQRAIGTDQGQKYVYVVAKDSKIAYRRVTLGLLFDGLQAIERVRAGRGRATGWRYSS